MKLVDRAKKIQAVALDADGVIFSGRVFIDSDGARLKERSHVDAQGISLLRSAGIHIAIVSGGMPEFVRTLELQLNSAPSVARGDFEPIAVFTGLLMQRNGKVGAIEEWLFGHGLSWPQCAYMGDDISDYEILKKVGLAAAPVQAEDMIKEICHFVAPRRGGDGAVRDLANLILFAKGVDPRTLSLR